MKRFNVAKNMYWIIVVLAFPFLKIISYLYYDLELKTPVHGMAYISLIYYYLFLIWFSHLYSELNKHQLWKNKKSEIFRWLILSIVADGFFLFVLSVFMLYMLSVVVWPLIILVIIYGIYRSFLRTMLYNILNVDQ